MGQVLKRAAEASLRKGGPSLCEGQVRMHSGRFPEEGSIQREQHMKKFKSSFITKEVILEGRK